MINKRQKIKFLEIRVYQNKLINLNQNPKKSKLSNLNILIII